MKVKLVKKNNNNDAVKNAKVEERKDKDIIKESIDKDNVIKDEVVSLIYKSTDYDMFKFIKGNRKLNDINIRKLIKSMEEEQLLIPICVNDKYEIIDGQHRFVACKHLGLPIFYYIIENYNTMQMKRANLVSATWTKSDFLNLYVSEELDDYLFSKELLDKHKITVCDFIKIVAKITNRTIKEVSDEFENGFFELTESTREKASSFLTALEDFSFFKKEYKKSKFVGAFMDLYFHNGYSHKHMKNRLASRKSALEFQLSKDRYLLILANYIYSYGNSKDNIYYDIERNKLYMTS